MARFSDRLLRLLLVWMPIKQRIEEDDPFQYQVSYQTLFGRENVLKRVMLPPRHHNCRCMVMPKDSQ